jgi:hypothetical protein
LFPARKQAPLICPGGSAVSPVKVVRIGRKWTEGGHSLASNGITDTNDFTIDITALGTTPTGSGAGGGSVVNYVCDSLVSGDTVGGASGTSAFTSIKRSARSRFAGSTTISPRRSCPPPIKPTSSQLGIST